MKTIMKSKEKGEQMLGNIIQGWSTIKYTSYYFFWEFPEENHKRQMCFSSTDRFKLEKLHEFLKKQASWEKIRRAKRLQIISAFSYSEKII